jgi:DNA polymerase-3 subunit delta'
VKFAEVIGQDAVKQRLLKTVKDNRVSHAQLFLGPEGSGKLALAIAYAQFINCTNRTSDDSCGTCPSCIKYGKLIHPDLHFIYPTAPTEKLEKPISLDFIAKWRELLIETKCYIDLPSWYEKVGIERKQAIINTRDCSEILRTLSYKSYEAEYKVMIIWMVEKLFHAAAPKILKILEEPPDKTLFILVSENQEQILKTILSRTQLIKIPQIDEEKLTEELINENFEPARVNDALRIAGGNYLEAKRMIGMMDDETQNFTWFSTWMRLCFNGRTSEMLEFIGGLSKLGRDEQKGFLNYSLRMIRQSMLISMDGNELVRLNKDESGFIYGSGSKRFYPYIHQQNVQLISEELNDSIYHIERNAHAGILFMDLSFKLGNYLKIPRSQESGIRN